MSDFSFDIVSKVEKQALEDAVNQAAREIATRFDFKNSKSSVEQTGEDITIVADDEMKLKNVVDILSETFKLDRASITPEANLYTDLDIDSIDAIDLLVKMQQMTGKRMKPEAFKNARTVQDVVDAIDTLLKV